MKLAYVLMGVFLLGACAPVPPKGAKKITHITKTCGGELADSYYWMRLTDDQKNNVRPDAQTRDVLDFLHAENQYAERVMAKHAALAETLFEEMKARVKDQDASLPYKENGYEYFTRTVTGADYPQYWRSRDGKETCLLDVNELAAGHNFCSVMNVEVSPDGRYVLFLADYIGRRQYVLYVKDLESGKVLDEKIENVSYTALWGADSRSIYYVGKDMMTLRADKIYRHKVGESLKDEMLYFEDDETFAISLKASSDKKYIFIHCNQTTTDECLYLDASNNGGAFASFRAREKGVKYTLDHGGDRFYILTNRDGALDYKVMTCKDREVARGRWEELLPCREGRYIRNFKVFDRYLALNEEKEANYTISVMNLETGVMQDVLFDEECYSVAIDVNKEASATGLRVRYQSMLTPPTIYEYDMETRNKSLLKVTEVPTYDASRYNVERIWATAEDGTRIPISVLFKNGFVKDGSGSVFLYGYGSYGASSNPVFDADVFSLVDRGFVYAIAHVRGGSEMGRFWYEDGKLLHKMNTFTDFNTCARHLVAKGYATSEHLYAYGASAGGLLMGACMNLAPDLYHGIIAGVPFVDVVNTMIDETIPLTTFEWEEWGDPREEPYYSYMLSYSPYDNVQARNYPNLLVTSGYWDSQVQYWEPAKWVAKLREMKTDKNLLLFLCNMEAGHGGATGRYKRLWQTAREYTFILGLEK